MSRIIRPIALIAAAFLLGACADTGLSGAWVDEAGITRYEFEQDGQARITVLETTVDASYDFDGDRVLVTSPQGTVVLKIRDGYLLGPMGLELFPAGPATGNPAAPTANR